MTRVLVLNTGSSSLKWTVLTPDREELSAPGSRVRALVIRSREELAILQGLKEVLCLRIHINQSAEVSP